MKDLQTALATGNYLSKPRIEPVKSEELHEQEKKAVNYFFSSIKSVYGDRAKTCFASDAEEMYQKQQFASVLRNLSKGCIDTFFAEKRHQQLKNGAEWPNLYDLIGEVTGIKQNPRLIEESWQHFVNRKKGDPWPNKIDFEVAKRVQCSANDLISARHNNSVPKAKREYHDLYNDVLSDIANGLELPELMQVLEHQAGSNKNRTEADKNRIEKSQGYQDFKKLFKEAK